jgi:ABC-2 type transport system permease protein
VSPGVAERPAPALAPAALGVARAQGWRHQLNALAAIAGRDLTKLLRDRLRLAVSLVIPVMLVVGLGNVLGPTIGRASGLDELEVAFSGVLAATLFQSAAAGMVSVVEDREADFARQLFVAPVARLSLLAGKVAGETCVALAQGVLLVVFALAFGVHAGPARLGLLLGPAVACCLLGAAFGLATVAALPSQRSAMQVFQFLIIPQYVLGGVLVPLHGVAPAVGALAWAMPLHYGVDLLQAAYYAGNPAYHSVVALGPAPDGAALAALTVALLAAGTALFVHRERDR